MTDSPDAPAIDAEVAAFAASLEGLTAIDESDRHADTAALREAILNATTSRDAASAVLRFDAHRISWPRAYRQRVIVEAMCAVTVDLALFTPPMLAPALAARLRDCAAAISALGLQETR